MGHKPRHRGFEGDIAAFGYAFVSTRTIGFLKHIDICLTDTPNDVGGVTHAYFPALATCCAFLEYMTGLARGRLDNVGWRDVAAWAQIYLPQPGYSTDVIAIVMRAFRNSVAHRGIAAGIWCDKSNHGQATRRITWKLLETGGHPACQLIEEQGTLVKDPPWKCSYTHRMHIYLRTFADDLSAGARAFAENLRIDANLKRRFERAMNELYPE
ncbi:MAG: hypothetical protein ACREQV_20515 [Candidatus Binatia bacterium]